MKRSGPSRRSPLTAVSSPWSALSRGQWILGGTTGVGVTVFLFSNFSPSIALTILGVRSQPLPLVVWITLAGIAGAVTALVFQSLIQGMAPPIQVTRPRSTAGRGWNGGRTDRPNARPSRSSERAAFVEPWDEEELTDWVEGRSPAPTNPGDLGGENEFDDRPGQSPWQRVAAASRGSQNGRGWNRDRSTAGFSPGVDRTPDPHAVAIEIGGGWDDRPNPDNDWEVLLAETQQGAAPEAETEAATEAAGDRTGAQREGTPAASQTEASQSQASQSRSPQSQAPPPQGSSRPSGSRLYEVQRSPVSEQRSGSVYTYRYRQASASDRSPGDRSPGDRSGESRPPAPSGPPRSPRPTDTSPRRQQPPAYLNNPQAGQPNAVYDVDYRVITPPQADPDSPPTGGQKTSTGNTRSRQAAGPSPRNAPNGTPHSGVPSPAHPKRRPGAGTPSPTGSSQPGTPPLNDPPTDDWDRSSSTDW